MNISDRTKLARFQEVLTERLVKDFHGVTTTEDRNKSANARAEVEHLKDLPEYLAAVDAAHREQTACMVDRWQRPPRA